MKPFMFIVASAIACGLLLGVAPPGNMGTSRTASKRSTQQVGVSTPGEPVTKTEDRPAVLAIDETLGTIFMPKRIGRTAMRSVANPKAKPYLYKILADDRLTRYYREVWYVMGYIGDASDVSRIARALEDREAAQQLFGHDGMRGMFECLGLMCARDVDGATELVDQLQQLAYWRHAPWRLRAERGPNQASVEFHNVLYVMIGYTLSQKPDILDRWKRIGPQLTHPVDTRIFADIIRHGFVEHGRKIRQWERRTSTLQLQQEAVVWFNGDLQNPGPRKREEADAMIAALRERERRNRSDDLRRKLRDWEGCVKEGDPLIVPILRDWLAEEAAVRPLDEKLLYGRLGRAIAGLASFHDKQSLPQIVRLYHDTDAHQRVRSQAASAAARIASIHQETDELLAEIMRDESVAMFARTSAAAALFRRGNASARKFLLEKYDQYRIDTAALRGTEHACAHSELQQLYDENVIAALRERLPAETHPRLKRNIAVLITRMEFNNASLDELRRFVEETAWEHAERRYAAIEGLGIRGTADDIPRLEHIQPWAPPPREFVDVQQRQVIDAAVDAIGKIKRRTWALQQMSE